METTATEKRSLFGGDAARKFAAFGALIAMFVVFSLASSNFLSFSNITGILLATAVNGVLALGVTFVIITAGIDLSVGTVMTLSAVMTGVFITNLGLPIPFGVLGGILAGATAGLINGTMIAKMKIPPFVATLGMLYIAKGLALVISGLKPIYFTDTPEFSNFAMGSVLGRIIPGFDIPNAVLIFFFAAILASFILNRTILGRYTYALGSNEEATRLSGVNVDAWKMAVYTLAGAFAGLGGVIMASRLKLGPAGAGCGLRAGRHRRGRHRRHVAERRRGHHPRHGHRRVHHQHLDQRPAHSLCAAGMADRRDRRHLDPGRLCRHAAPSSAGVVNNCR